MKMTFPHEEGQYFIWVGEPLKTVSYNAGLKSTLSFLPKRQISPNQGEQEGRDRLYLLKAAEDAW